MRALWSTTCGYAVAEASVQVIHGFCSKADSQITSVNGVPLGVESRLDGGWAQLVLYSG